MVYTVPQRKELIVIVAGAEEEPVPAGVETRGSIHKRCFFDHVRRRGYIVRIRLIGLSEQEITADGLVMGDATDVTGDVVTVYLQRE